MVHCTLTSPNKLRIRGHSHLQSLKRMSLRKCWIWKFQLIEHTPKISFSKVVVDAGTGAPILVARQQGVEISKSEAPLLLQFLKSFLEKDGSEPASQLSHTLAFEHPTTKFSMPRGYGEFISLTNEGLCCKISGNLKANFQLFRFGAQGIVKTGVKLLNFQVGVYWIRLKFSRCFN